MGLTPAERQQFHDLGYVVKESLYAPADLQPLKDGLTAVIDQTCAALQEEGLLGAETFAAEPFETRLGVLFTANAVVGERVTQAIMGRGGGGFKEQAILSFLRHSPLVSCIESLVGPNIIGSSVYRIRPKAPGYSRGAVPWHQDSGYFMPHCDQSLIVTCWQSAPQRRLSPLHRRARRVSRNCRRRFADPRACGLPNARRRGALYDQSHPPRLL